MKGFYVFTEGEACFDCGEASMEIIGFYKGEPTKEKMMKLAEKKFQEAYDRKPTPEDMEGNDRLLDVGEKFFRIFHTYTHADYYEAREFELKDALKD